MAVRRIQLSAASAKSDDFQMFNLESIKNERYPKPTRSSTSEDLRSSPAVHHASSTKRTQKVSPPGTVLSRPQILRKIPTSLEKLLRSSILFLSFLAGCRDSCRNSVASSMLAREENERLCTFNRKTRGLTVNFAGSYGFIFALHGRCDRPK